MDKVAPGQKIQFKASDWNDIQDAVRAEKNRQASIGGGPMLAGLGANIMLAVNSTGGGMVSGAAAVVTGFRQAPADCAVRHNAVLEVGKPEADDNRGLAVSVDGCKSGGVGRFYVAGPVLVYLQTAPQDGQRCVRFGASGALEPSEGGPASILAYNAAAKIALILAGGGSTAVPMARGMFQLMKSGETSVKIGDGNAPESGTAGIAVVNTQSFSCPAATFALTAAVKYFYLKFTPPQTTGGTETLPESLCNIVEVADGEAVVSTDKEVYSLIGHAWTETTAPDEEGNTKTIVTLAQDHTPGMISITWYGPCLDLLSEIEDA